MSVDHYNYDVSCSEQHAQNKYQAGNVAIWELIS